KEFDLRSVRIISPIRRYVDEHRRDVQPRDAATDDPIWQRRTNGRPLRFTSTNHFMYRGYWIWLIPYARQVFKGVEVAKLRVRTDGFAKTGMLSEERQKLFAILERSGDAARFASQVKHFNLAMRTRYESAKQQFSEDRWFLTGMSGMFTDPMLSTTSAQ